MAARRLSVVSPDTKTKPPPRRKRPLTLKAAAELSERDLLATMRSKAAAEIDAGVPAHALPRLMTQLREIDKEIRAIDARAQQEEEARRGDVEDEAFDASAI